MSQPPTPKGFGDRAADPSDIPVTVVGGYLGSGKTTLVNHLLRAGTERVAVLVNDFGEVDIDAALIERDDGDTIALANGCVCCSLVDGLSAALATVASFDPKPDRLVIEASGVADPGTVAAYGHGPGFGLDAVIVLVDAETVRQRASDKYVGDTVLRQLRSADVVVINKIDLVGPEQVAEVGSWLRGRVDGAVIIEAREARVDPAVLFGRVEAAGVESDPTLAASHGHADQVFESWTWSADRAIDRSVIETLMGQLPESVVRAKGILWLDDDDEGQARAEVLQRVGARWSLRPAPPTAAFGQQPRSRLVLIGHHGAITGAWLDQQLGD